MKTVIMITAIICSYLVGFSQAKKTKQSPNNTVDPNKFMGIGLFKIGCDTNTVKQVANNLNSVGIPIYIMNSDDIYSYQDKTSEESNEDVELHVFRIGKNDQTENIGTISGDNKCPDIQMYFLTEYIVDDVKVYNIILAFYKNKLIGFSSDDSIPLEKAMNLKYGPGSIKAEKKIISCVYTLTGIKEDYEEATYFLTWKNGNIEATSVVNKLYDDKCTVQVVSGFWYNSINKEYEAWEDNHRYDYLKPKGNKSDLKDF